MIKEIMNCLRFISGRKNYPFNLLLNQVIEKIRQKRFAVNICHRFRQVRNNVLQPCAKPTGKNYCFFYHLMIVNLYVRILIPKMYILFPETCVLFLETHVLFPETCVLFLETCVLFPETHVLFSETHVLFPETHVIFPETCVIFPETYIIGNMLIYSIIISNSY